MRPAKEKKKRIEQVNVKGEKQNYHEDTLVDKTLDANEQRRDAAARRSAGNKSFRFIPFNEKLIRVYVF